MAEITNGMAGSEARDILNNVIGRKYNPISKQGIKFNIMSSSSGARTAQSQTTAMNIGGGVTLSADNLVLAIPFIPSANIVASSIGIECTVGGAGAGVKLHIYDDQSGQPNNILFGPATFDCSTTGVKTYEDSITFNQGQVYWTVIHTARPSANFTVRAAAVATNYNLGINVGTNNYYTGYYGTIPYGSLSTTSLWQSLTIGTIQNAVEAQFTVQQG